MPSFSKVAAASIHPSRFVMLDTADGKVIEATAGGKIYGISQPGQRNTPYSSLQDGYCAIAGENVRVYGPGEDSKCLLEIGAGGCSPGDRLKATTNGVGIATTADGDEYGAVAEFAGVSGQLVMVLVTTGQRGA